MNKSFFDCKSLCPWVCVCVCQCLCVYMFVVNIHDRIVRPQIQRWTHMYGMYGVSVYMWLRLNNRERKTNEQVLLFSLSVATIGRFGLVCLYETGFFFLLFFFFLSEFNFAVTPNKHRILMVNEFLVCSTTYVI